MSNENEGLKLNKKNTHHLKNNLRLALDIGTNSIGWALYDMDKNKKPKGIKGTGVRVFSDGRQSKDYTTLNATRRQARLQRRQRDRYLQRRSYLLSLLKKHGLFPEDDFSAKKLAHLNPYELRATGLDEKLNIYYFGRVLFHLNQRRGFKSNRKSSVDTESGVISKSIKHSQQQLNEWGARTYGEFLWKRLQKMQESRKKQGSHEKHWILARKPLGAGMNDNYAVYAQRSMLEDEFNKLWNAQAKYHDELKNQKLKDLFYKTIFKHRPLKKPVVGKCYFTGEKRMSKALPSFQRFRILKELNNLSYITIGGYSYPVNKIKKGDKTGIQFRDDMIINLFQKKKKITFSLLEKEFKNYFNEMHDFSYFNLDVNERDSLEGEQTSIILQKIIPQWNAYSLDIQDHFVELLEGESNEGDFMLEDERVLKNLQDFNKANNLDLSQEQLEKCMKSLSQLPSGHGMYSKKAIQKFIPFLEKGELENQAIHLSGWHHSNRRYKGKILNRLPNYQKILGDHCVPVKLSIQSDKKEKEEVRIPNPTVHIAFNQLKLLVNDIIRVYGSPMQIIIETARDLPMGQKTKGEEIKKQNKNKQRNNEAKNFIEEFGEKNNRDNRIKYQLWIEQQHTCIYSGQKIPKNKLFTSELEIDHILPYSKTLDDSYMNKVLVYKTSNQQKGNQTPFEAFSHNKNLWSDILLNIKNLSVVDFKGKKIPWQKSWRFQKNAMEEFEKDGGFLARQLNDTRYISKYAKEYLTSICKDVWTVRGQTTSLLSHVLQYDKKNRGDHRSHAKDALAIGLIDRSLVQHISNIAKNEEASKKRLENISSLIKKDVIPWDSFKEDSKRATDQIVVSHRKRTKKEGQLHKETAYGVSKDITDYSKKMSVIHYVDIMTLSGGNKKKIENDLVSESIKKDFLRELDVNRTLSKEFLIEYHNKTGVRRVRLKENKTIIPIKNKSGRVYKAFDGGSNYAMEFFQKENGKWDAQVIDTFSANQKDFLPIPTESKLMKGDMLFFDDKFWKLVKFDQNKIMIFLEHHISGNPDNLRKKTETKHHVNQKNPSSLQKSNPKRVDISPCGIVKLTHFAVSKLSKNSERIA